MEEDFTPRPSTGVLPHYRTSPQPAAFSLGRAVTTSVAEAYNAQEDTHWPTRLIFNEDEVADAADAGLEFEFDPTRVPRPRLVRD